MIWSSKLRCFDPLLWCWRWCRSKTGSWIEDVKRQRTRVFSVRNNGVMESYDSQSAIFIVSFSRKSLATVAAPAALRNNIWYEWLCAPGFFVANGCPTSSYLLSPHWKYASSQQDGAEGWLLCLDQVDGETLMPKTEFFHFHANLTGIWEGRSGSNKERSTPKSTLSKSCTTVTLLEKHFGFIIHGIWVWGKGGPVGLGEELWRFGKQWV